MKNGGERSEIWNDEYIMMCRAYVSQMWRDL